MNIKVFDNWAPDELVRLYFNYFVEMPHKLKEYSSNGELVFKNAHLSYDVESNFFTSYLRDQIMSKICEISNTKIDDFQVYRYHTNMQFPDQGGKTFHKDGTVCTAVLNLSHTDGKFQYLDNGVATEIEDKFNRLILFFEPEMQHRGIPPSTNDNGPRLTLALKLFLNNSK
jgi:hypothetical protein